VDQQQQRLAQYGTQLDQQQGGRYSISAPMLSVILTFQSIR
jgi:hypothetical protein